MADRCVPANVCSDLQLDASDRKVHSEKLTVMYPNVTEGCNLTVVSVKDAKQYALSGKVVSIDFSNLPVGDYSLEMPGSGDLPQCELIKKFALSCAPGYEREHCCVCFW